MARHHNKSRDNKSRGRHAATETAETAEMMEEAVDRTAQPIREGMQRSLAAGRQQFGVLSERAFESWVRTSNETLQRVVELNAELAAWGREQLDDSLGAVRSLSQCRSFGDAYGVQLGLMRSTMENSLRHANKVLSLSANVMAAGTSAAQGQAQAD